MSDDALVIFTPSGKRGRVVIGTSVLQAARQLGVDLDSVCGGRGICSKCQVAPAFGAFPKHGITVGGAALSPPNEVEDRYDRVRGLPPGRRLGCQARIMADVVLAAIIHQVQILAVGCLYSGGDGAPAQAGPAPGL